MFDVHIDECSGTPAILQAWTNCSSYADQVRLGAQNLRVISSFSGAQILSCETVKTLDL